MDGGESRLEGSLLGPRDWGHPDGGTGHINGLDPKSMFGQTIMLPSEIANEGMEFELVGGRFLRLKSLHLKINDTRAEHYLEKFVGQYLISVTNSRGLRGFVRGMSFEDILEAVKVEPSSSGSRQVATSMHSSHIRLFFVRRPDVVFNNPVVAAELGLTEIVQFLIQEKRLDVNGSWVGIGASFPGNSLLFTSLLASTDISILRYLVTVPGANFDIRTKDEALIHRIVGLCGKPKLDRLEVLLRHGTVDVNARTTRGRTALHVACEKRHVDAEVVRLLLQYGANIHSRSADVLGAPVGAWNRETPVETLSSMYLYGRKIEENRSKKIHLLVKASGAKSSGELGRMFPLLGRAWAYDSAQVLWSIYLEQSAANGERAALRRSKRRAAS